MASNPEGTELPDVAAVEARAASMSRAAVVSSTSPKLTNGQRRHLRGLGHHLRPVVQIGHHGLTEGLVTALDKALETHELVKVKALEWRHFDNGNGYVNTPAGLSYAIYANGDWCLRNGPMLETVGGTLDSAKAAAQADYERRIRSALDEVFPQAGKNFTTQPAAPQEAEPEGQQCERCQGNGEIVTDWERYRHPHDGDVGDEAVAECPDCNGEGAIAEDSAPQEAGR